LGIFLLKENENRSNEIPHFIVFVFTLEVLSSFTYKLTFSVFFHYKKVENIEASLSFFQITNYM